MRYTQRQPGWASSSAPPQGSDVDYLFTVDNRGKRSITVDMKQEEGQRVVRRLASKCDVLLTNLLPERLAKFNLDSETLQKENPGLIYAVVSPWGLPGADMDNPGFDMTAFFARGGQMSINGPPGTAPVVPRPGQGDHTTGLAALSAILAALRLRDQTGRGTVVETSLLRTSAWQIAADMSTALIDGEQPKRADRTAAPNPLTVYYRVQGGRYILAMMPFNDQNYWPRFCEAAGKPEWGSKYLRRKLRAADGPAIMEELDRIFGSFSLDTATHTAKQKAAPHRRRLHLRRRRDAAGGGLRPAVRSGRRHRPRATPGPVALPRRACLRARRARQPPHRKRALLGARGGRARPRAGADAGRAHRGGAAGGGGHGRGGGAEAG